jgi:hypothetical protein
VVRHIFQACPVWIYTQSNITSIIIEEFARTKNTCCNFPCVHVAPSTPFHPRILSLHPTSLENLQSRAKIIETTKSLPPPPSPHKQCWTNYAKVYCQVKSFFNIV